MKSRIEIVSKSIILELPETLETGSAKILCDKPYNIERKETKDEVIWYGYNTNWKLDKKSKQWSMLVDSQFVNCDIPEYEKIYNQRDSTLSKINKLLNY